MTGGKRGFEHKDNDRKESFGLYFLSVIEFHSFYSFYLLMCTAFLLSILYFDYEGISIRLTGEINSWHMGI